MYYTKYTGTLGQYFSISLFKIKLLKYILIIIIIIIRSLKDIERFIMISSHTHTHRLTY